MTENVIFIDIDGVLLPLKEWKTPENAAILKTRPEGFMQHIRFNAEAVRLVVRLADLSGAKLVLSSNWRRTWGPDSDALMRKLVAEGLREDLWHEDWFLPVLGLKPRKFDEIADWLDNHPPCRALVIDDEAYAGPPLPKPNGVIATDEREGYTASDDEAARGFFGVVAPETPPTDDGASDHDKPAKFDPYAPEREAFMRGEPGSCLPIGQYLGEIGCASFPPGQSALWFRGDGPDQGHWLYALATPQEGPAAPGYRIILTFGREKAGSIEMEGCVLLDAEDRHGNRVVFDKGCLVRHEGDAFVPASPINEAELVGRVSDIGFGSRPFHFAA